MRIPVHAEEQLAALQAMPKRVINPRAKWTEKPTVAPAYRQRSFKARAESDEKIRFEIYQREHLEDATDFSSGIAAILRDGSRLILARYNGSSHEHGDIAYEPHIHRATEKAMTEGRKPEFYAEPTDRYRTVHGALACLLDDFEVPRDPNRIPHDQRPLL